jgi:hypothetical protein
MMPKADMTSEQYRREHLGQREHKYHAKGCKVDGISFPSRKEANRYGELKILERGGVIKNLDVDAHAPIILELQVNGIHVTNYRPDFKYWHVEHGRMIYEDVKGFATDVYRLKKKLVRACLGIEITET